MCEPMKKTVVDSSSSQGIKSLDIAFSILDCFKEANEPLSVTELTKRMNLTKSRIHKYLVSFSSIGILMQNKKNLTYSLGPKMIELGLAALRQYDIASVADPYLRDLRDRLN